MNVIYLHCHYRRGGVTQVVHNQVASLAAIADRMVLASGGRNEGLSEACLTATESLVVRGLDYDAVVGRQDARAVAGELIDAMRRMELQPEQTVLHWHNHSLGKNVATPAVIRHLHESGYRQLLQIHDFAEDYRVENYAGLIRAAGARDAVETSDYCYPAESTIHYATLTGGDADVLTALGMPGERVHLLPNSVTLGDKELPDAGESLAKVTRLMGLDPDARWALYPVRGIRRKNLGEFCLLAMLLPEDVWSGVTLRPDTEIEARSYARWKSIAEEHAPRAVFDAGTLDDLSFTENLAACSFVLSTSVAEGFGMAYLEPWLAGRGVIARRLAGVVQDFEQSGMELNRFYDALAIPGSADWLAEVREESAAAFRSAWRGVSSQFRPPLPETLNTEDDCIDFAKLTSQRQIEIIRRCSQDDGFAGEVRRRNAGLIESAAQPFNNDIIARNREVIGGAYSLQQTATQLSQVYSKVLAETDSPGIQLRRETSSVELICGVREFFPCRTEEEIEVG